MANCPRNENTVPLSFYWNALFAALPTIRQVIASTPPPITPPTTGTILVRLIMPFSPAFVKSLNPTISLILTSRDRESCSITLYVILLDAEAPKGFVVLLNRHIKCFLTLHNISCLKTVIHKSFSKSQFRQKISYEVSNSKHFVERPFGRDFRFPINPFSISEIREWHGHSAHSD